MQVRQRKAEGPGSWMSCVEGALRTLKKRLQCDKGTGLELGKEERRNRKRTKNDCRGRGRVRGCYVGRTAREPSSNPHPSSDRLSATATATLTATTADPQFHFAAGLFPSNSMSGRPILFVAASSTSQVSGGAAFHLILFFYQQTFFPLLSHSAGPLDRFLVRTHADRGSVLPFLNNLATFLAS
jgi:hypothetical protein